jgi:hypothetical protein
VIAGRNRGLTLGLCEIFDGAHAWAPGPALTDRRGSHSAVMVADTVLVLAGGGAAAEANLTSIESINANTLSPTNPKTTGPTAAAAPTPWALNEFPPMRRARHAQGAAVIGGHALYVVGGQGVDATTGVYGTFADVEMLDLKSPVHTRTWASVPPCHIPRRLHGCAASGGQLFVFGGAVDQKGALTSSAERYDPSTGAWSEIKSLPKAAACRAHAFGPGLIVLLLEMHGVFTYDPAEDTYTRRAALPVTGWTSFASCSGFGADESTLYAVGGASQGRWLDCAWALDTATFTWTPLPPMRHVRRRTALVALPPME